MKKITILCTAVLLFSMAWILPVSAADSDFIYETNSWGVEITGYTGSGGAVTVPAKIGGVEVTEIGAGAFKDCAGLTEVTLPESVESIGRECFSGCTDLTAVSLPASLDEIPERAFYGCSSLTGIEQTGEILLSISEIGDGAFEGCTSLAGSLNLRGLEKIGEAAFKNCSSLESISTVKASVTVLENETFYGCSSLNTAAVSVNITRIGDRVFEDCRSLTGYTLGRTIESIGESAFKGCSALTDLTGCSGSALQEIGISAFEDCTSLKEFGVPGTVDQIPAAAFRNCSSLESLDLGSVHELGEDSFAGCISLGSVTIPEETDSIGARAFYGCTSLAQISIPSGVSVVGPSVFKGCAALEQVSLPAGITEIGESAFEDCAALKQLLIGKGLTVIGKSAFRGCGGLEELSVPDTIREIGADAFSGCGKLGTVYCCGTPENFSGIAGKEQIPAPAWYYSVTGQENAPQEAVIQKADQSVGEIRIPAEIMGIRVTSVGEQVFEGCGQARTVYIPETVTEISRSAFEGSGIETISAADGNAVYSSKNGMLYDKEGTGLLLCPPGRKGALEIPEGTIRIEEGALSGCAGLTELKIPLSVTLIGENASSGCSGLTKIIYEGNEIQWGYMVTIRSGNSAVLNAELECAPPVYVTVRFVSYGIGEYDEVSVIKYDLLSEPESRPERAGYTFLGWYDGNEKWDFRNDRLEKDTKLYAKWASEEQPVSRYNGAWYDSEGYMIVPSASKIFLEVSPAIAAYPDRITDIDWQSAESSVHVAHHTTNGDYRAEIQTGEEGVAEITCYLTSVNIGEIYDEQVQYQTFKLRVVNPAASVSFGEPTLFMAEGSSAILDIRTAPEGEWAKAAAGFTISSSDESVAAVRSDGCIEAVGTGQAVITAALADGTAASCTVTVGEGTEIMRGDVDQDGEVDIRDLRLVLRSVCGKIALTEVQKQAADVETDGEVDIKDLRKILRFVCKKIEAL